MLLLVLAQAEDIDPEVKQIIAEAAKEAATIRPGEFLMAGFGLILLFLLLRHLNRKDASFSSTVKEFTATVEHINTVNQDRNDVGRRECHAQQTEMVKSSAVVAEMARDVKEAVASLTNQTLAQERMLGEQGKLLHHQRGIMQTVKSLAEAMMTHQALKDHTHHHHQHTIITPTPKIEEDPQ